MSIQIFSQWSNQPRTPAPMTDEERHAAFTEFAIRQAQMVLPWLLPLLNQANATLWVAPRFFSFRLPNNPDQWFEVPQIEPYIAMVPWAEPHETPQ
ncbi:MAG: hypothetical protein GXD23_06570 [Comamonadaceae bacterium]|jgi:hypothetical protein|nr:hypothetical protein [Comamonadaceae bacterium]